MNGEWVHSLVEIVGVFVTIWLYMRSSRKRAIVDIERRDKANQQKLDALIIGQSYLPQHWHQEAGKGDVPLLSSGIIRKPRPNGDT